MSRNANSNGAGDDRGRPGPGLLAFLGALIVGIGSAFGYGRRDRSQPTGRIVRKRPGKRPQRGTRGAIGARRQNFGTRRPTRRPIGAASSPIPGRRPGSTGAGEALPEVPSQIRPASPPVTPAPLPGSAEAGENRAQVEFREDTDHLVDASPEQVYHKYIEEVIKARKWVRDNMDLQ